MSEGPEQAEIMLVDDVPQNLEVLSMMLQKEGFKVRPVTSGGMALKSALAYPPDLVLLDIMMPEMDGYEVCERLKEQETTYDVPVIFVSAKDAAFDKVRAFEVGGVDYITKPFFAHEVLARIKTHLNLYWHRQQLILQRNEIATLRERDKHQYEEMTQMKDDFLQMVSHDLKNPIAFVRTALYMLRKSGRITHEKDTRYLDTIEDGIDQMMALVVDVLDIARLETGVGIDCAVTAFGLFVEYQLKKLIGLAEQKSLSLEYHLPQKDVLVCLDSHRMAQVVQNLVSNAIKYTPSGQVLVETGEYEGKAFLRVTDTGLGIPEEHIEHLFDKFYRIPRDAQTTIEGTGLGLAITKTIVELHGGYIEVESEDGVGTTMTAFFPIAEQQNPGIIM